METDEERAILDRLAGAIVSVSEEDIIVYANAEALVLLGWDPSLPGHPLTSIIPSRLQERHLRGFDRYVKTGVSRLQGTTVRVPARRQDGTEVDVDLTIRVFQRPDKSRLAVAALSKAPLGRAPSSIRVLEDALARRVYELI
jgi:PAS domain S-box-containing protein